MTPRSVQPYKLTNGDTDNATKTGHHPCLSGKRIAIRTGAASQRKTAVNGALRAWRRGEASTLMIRAALRSSAGGTDGAVPLFLEVSPPCLRTAFQFHNRSSVG